MAGCGQHEAIGCGQHGIAGCWQHDTAGCGQHDIAGCGQHEFADCEQLAIGWNWFTGIGCAYDMPIGAGGAQLEHCASNVELDENNMAMTKVAAIKLRNMMYSSL